jgi:RimJ/RimL family protein N-acetyltransferase
MISVRSAHSGDEYDLWVWRNDPVTRQMSRETTEVPREVNQKWFSDSLADPGRFIYLVEDDRGKLGMVRFDEFAAGDFQISINLNPDWRGRGLCRPVLGSAIDHFTSGRGSLLLRADVKDDNTASKKCFLANGFVLKRSEGGFQFYERTIGR